MKIQLIALKALALVLFCGILGMFIGTAFASVAAPANHDADIINRFFDGIELIGKRLPAAVVTMLTIGTVLLGFIAEMARRIRNAQKEAAKDRLEQLRILKEQSETMTKQNVVMKSTHEAVKKVEAVQGATPSTVVVMPSAPTEQPKDPPTS